MGMKTNAKRRRPVQSSPIAGNLESFLPKFPKEQGLGLDDGMSSKPAERDSISVTGWPARFLAAAVFITIIAVFLK